MNSLRLGFIGALILAFPSIGHGQAIVVVDFNLNWPNWTSLRGEQTTNSVEADVKQKIAGVLRSRYPHWTFAPAVSGQPVHLNLQVEESENTVVLTLEASPASPEEWSATWLKPGDLQAEGLPLAHEFAARVTKAFKDRILDQYPSAIDAWLKKNAPIAVSGIWHPSPAQKFNIVFPLPFEQHRSLGSATLEVKGDPQLTGPTQWLTVLGFPQAAPYPPGSAVPEFDAVQGVAFQRRVDTDSQAEKIQDAMAQQLKTLSLSNVYLLEVKRQEFQGALNPLDQR